ncbi:hypothetical protein GQ55_3G139000 [Panicum hallii var. hallii]|uniref:Uncharacterized protein n=1 Tax=Panicum hallii var. hallii TaxID=1504633 RepID=A0A2T7E992_9POAL|nr:hypothetical protein GQ55_3G139000 [Panicum hallii var. hallii]
MDEQVSCKFHSERKRDPGKFKNQLTDQGTTRMVGCFPNPPFFKSPSDVSSWDSFFLDAIRVRSQLEPQQGGAPTDLQLLDRRQSLLSLVAPVIKNLHAPGLDEGKGLYFPFVSQGTKTAGGLPVQSTRMSYYKSDRPSYAYSNYKMTPTAAILCETARTRSRACNAQ